MARRRLTDLLREEAQKPEETKAEPVETTPQETETADPIAPADSAAAEAAKSIAALKTTLEQTQQREADLKDQVSDLQTKLDEQQALVKSLQSDLKRSDKLQKDLEEARDEQQALVKSLQTDLKRSDKLQKDLEEARKDALQLANANTKLAQEIEALKKIPSQPQPTAAIAKANVPVDQARQRRALSHPVFPNEPLPSQGAPLDTGWMD